MKKLWLLILGLCTLLFTWNFSIANDEYEYKNLNISADILEDWTIKVTERFTADFFVNKHWIIRAIPLNYSVGWNVFHIDVSDINVEWKTFSTEIVNSEINIKIWDSDNTVIWEEVYPISYTTYGLIKNFSGMGYSELYWNLVWYDFDTNINKVRAVILLPKTYTGFTNDDFLITTDWTTKTVEDFPWRVDRSHWDRIIISYDEWLPAYRGITLAIKFPNNYFEFDHDRQKSLVWRTKNEYSNLEYTNQDSVSNLSNSIIETDSELPILSETIETIVKEPIELASDQSDLLPEVIVEDSVNKQEIETDVNTITSNNYVSSWPKTKPISNPEYEFTNLNIKADILEDWTMNISEDYTADFHVNKHGIIRNIPLNYSVLDNPFHIDVYNINVAWKTFSTSKSNWEIEIKIWDADRTINWTQNYPISYTAYGLIKNFSGMWYAELYWNLVWYDFDTSINNVKAELYLPKTYTGLGPDDFLITVDWKKSSIYDFQWLVDWKWWNKITITYDRWLSSYHGITLSIKFPNDYFEFDHDRQAKLIWRTGYGSISDSAINNMWWISGFIWVIVFVIFCRKKLKLNNNNNKIDTKSWVLKWDLAKQFPVIVQYEPPKWVNSAEAGLLIHRGAKPKDMLSLIYKRAAEWLIKLSFEEEDWSFFKSASKNVVITKINDIRPDAPEYEKDFFKALIRSEKNKITATTNLYNKLSLSTLESHWKKMWWFSGGKSPGFLIVIWFIGLSLLIDFCEDSYPLISILAFFWFFALSIYASAASRLKETEAGARLISHLLWYRQFLAACDENKLRLFLQQDPLYFDKILPYAVAFGLDTELINKIEPIMKEMNIKSSWYDWDIHSIHYINNTISSSAISSVPPSYSSGGWFSSWSSFGWWFSRWWGGWWWGGRSW